MGLFHCQTDEMAISGARERAVEAMSRDHETWPIVRWGVARFKCTRRSGEDRAHQFYIDRAFLSNFRIRTAGYETSDGVLYTLCRKNTLHFIRTAQYLFDKNPSSSAPKKPAHHTLSRARRRRNAHWTQSAWIGWTTRGTLQAHTGTRAVSVFHV